MCGYTASPFAVFIFGFVPFFLIRHQFHHFLSLSLPLQQPFITVYARSHFCLCLRSFSHIHTNTCSHINFLLWLLWDESNCIYYFPCDFIFGTKLSVKSPTSMYKPPTSKWIVEFAKTVAIMVESAPTIWQWSCVSVSVCTLPLHLCLYMRINILMWILFSLFIRNGSEKECLQKTREFIRNWNCVCSHWNRQGAHVSYPWFISFSFPFSRLYFYIYTIFFCSFCSVSVLYFLFPLVAGDFLSFSFDRSVR